MKVYNNCLGANRNLYHKQDHYDQVVLNAIKRLGGAFEMRVMDFRKYLDESLRETHIKDSLKRLCDKGVLEKTSPKGQGYKLIIQ